MLEENEKLLKSFHHRSDVLEAISERMESAIDFMKPENIADALVAEYDQVIRKNALKWVDMLRMKNYAVSLLGQFHICQSESKNMSRMLSNTTNIIQGLKKLLVMSDGSCFLEYVNLEVDSTLKIEVDRNKRKVDEKHFSIIFPKNLEALVEESVLEFLRKIDLPAFNARRFMLIDLNHSKVLKVKQVIPLAIGKFIYKIPLNYYKFGSETVNLALEKEKVQFSLFCVNDERNVLEKTFVFDLNKIKSVFVSPGYVLFQRTDNYVLIYDLAIGVPIGLYSFSCDLLCFSVSDYSELRTVQWDEEKCLLIVETLVLNELFDVTLPRWELSVSERPKLVTCSVDFVVTVDKDWWLHICDTKKRNVVTFLPVEYGLSRIDKVIFNGTFDQLLISDFKFRELVIMSLYRDGWSISEAIKFNLPCHGPLESIDFVSLRGDGCGLFYAFADGQFYY